MVVWFLDEDFHQIVTKHGESFAIKTTQWLTKKNIEQMHDIVYDEMVNAKNAVDLDEANCVYKD